MEEHSLTCIICLERYKYPVTIPCGHTFCKVCISKHWDQIERGGHQNTSFNCPVCKKTFTERPTLNRNVSLSVLSEVAANSKAERAAGVACRTDRVEDGYEELCPCHQKPLIFYCRSDHMCVCSVCSVKECKDHDKVLVEEERSNREEGLKKKSIEIGKCMEDTENNIQALSENITEAKVSLQQTSQWVSAKFSQLLKVLTEKQEVTQSFLEQQQASTVAQAETQLSNLQEKLEQLRGLQEQISSLCSLPDCQFIQVSRLVEVPQVGSVPVDVTVNLQEKLNPVTDILSRISKMVCEDLDKAVYAAVSHNKEGSPQDKRPMLAVVPSPATPPYPAGKEGLIQYRCSLTFNPCTANAHLVLSQNNRRAEHLSSGPHTVPTDEARFDYTWQVLCSENFTHGRHYWELEVSKPWAYVGVTYPGIPRKEKGRTSMLGMNDLSWSLELNERQLTAWHGSHGDPVSGELQLSKRPLRIGMLLDYDEGTLAYYGENQVRLHAFHCIFSHELYPACWIGEGVSVTLCPM
ncbi:tripartite motif-containing protein 65 [Tachysurus fulvidraco]|uniref:tripartite motif-containing protein 65 n=1 Tax=Tachysurus fulvidraco TaxID=1234273 RepID=UPI001FEE2B5A|nr:tripartite motif-containing protein 65 [Tachysurus fulvidraco]